MYRPEIKVLDCTIRDGGLMNNWDFSMDVVKKVYRALWAAGVDYMEIGYRHDTVQHDVTKSGIWRFCPEEVIREVIHGVAEVPGKERPKISVMADIGKSVESDFLPKAESVVDMVRVATYDKQADKAVAFAKHCRALGYEVSINLMAISHCTEFEMHEALEAFKEAPVSVVVVVDSFGALYSEQVAYLVQKYQKYFTGKSIEVGIHMHNNQQLAFANTIEGIIRGANRLDGTLYGMGRAAGNCPTELLLSFLKNPKFDVRPLLDVISEVFIPLREKVEWGYLIPHMITGVLDEHPRAALAWLKKPERNEFGKFYQLLLEGVPIA
ncbi:MAG: nucleoid-structuring protein H-NS [Candidatus Sumerlaeia bacterium]|nr:nucleoid-structuring protein H-NS [Candidatus Sumerlaeia bacterium]